jgi:protein-S-isoprenylcysteine O-methyltransferase Ste14
VTPVSASQAIAAVFVVGWLAAALWADRTVAALPSREQQPLYGAGVVFVVIVLAAAWVQPALRARMWPAGAAFDWAMVALLVAGCAVCVWARVHLGRLWSGGVVLKEGHRVVDSGPYGFVRHPIYSGAFVAMVAFAAIRARPTGLLLSLGFIVFFALKSRLEERLLLREFGAAYEDYQRRVPRLVPRLKRR